MRHISSRHSLTLFLALLMCHEKCSAGLAASGNTISYLDCGERKYGTQKIEDFDWDNCFYCPDNSSADHNAAFFKQDCECIEGYTGLRGGPCSACPTWTITPTFLDQDTSGIDCIACPVNALTCTGADFSCKQYYSKKVVSAAASQFRRLLGARDALWDWGWDPTLSCTCSDAGYMETTDDSNTTSCTRCAAGTYKTDGVGQCLTCPVGTISESGSKELNDCKCVVGAAGTYKADGVGQCSTCPVGTISESGSKELNDCKCLVGYYGSSNGAECMACEPGTYKAATGVGQCSTCPVGTISESGSKELNDCKCLVGYYGSSNGAECMACEPGTYKAATGVGQCSTCPVGTISESGSKELNDCKCLVGYYGYSNGAECMACEPGTYKDAAGDGGCSMCPVGMTSAPASIVKGDCKCLAGYTALADASECSACSMGMYKNTVGTGACTACPADTSSARGSTNLGDCQCIVGYTATLYGLECSACGAGTYKDEAGDGECSLCPVGMTSAPASIVKGDCKCLAGYTPKLDDGHQTDCFACSAGTFTSGGVCRNCTTHSESFVGSTKCYCASGFTSSGGAELSCNKCPAHSKSAPDSTQCYCSAGFVSASDGDVSCERCDGCSFNVDFSMQLGGMTKKEMDADRQAEYVVSVARWLSVAPDDVCIISVTENTTSTTRRLQSTSSERERLRSLVTVETQVVASTEKKNSIVLVLTEQERQLEYRSTTIASVSSPVISAASIPITETQMEDVRGETVDETTQTHDNKSFFVYLNGVVRIASGVVGIVLSCALVCGVYIKKIQKNHAGSHDVYSKPRKTDVKSTPTDNNMYVRIDKPPFTKGTYYTRQ